MVVEGSGGRVVVATVVVGVVLDDVGGLSRVVVGATGGVVVGVVPAAGAGGAVGIERPTVGRGVVVVAAGGCVTVNVATVTENGPCPPSHHAVTL